MESHVRWFGVNIPFEADNSFVVFQQVRFAPDDFNIIVVMRFRDAQPNLAVEIFSDLGDVFVESATISNEFCSSTTDWRLRVGRFVRTPVRSLVLFAQKRFLMSLVTIIYSKSDLCQQARTGHLP